MLPDKPSDIQDDGSFHFAILNYKATSDSGKPSSEAKRYLDETTGPSRPRKYRNSIILVVPSRDGLEQAKDAIRNSLGWKIVASQISGQDVDPIRSETLQSNIRQSEKRMNEAIVQAYNIVVTVSKDNDAQAFRLSVGADPLFIQIKNDSRSRICDGPVNADALLPGGPYDLWQADDSARRVKDIIDAFAQFPERPKMLDRNAIIDTLAQGAKEGRFVLRSETSKRTYWFEAPESSSTEWNDLEVILSSSAQLTTIDPLILVPGKLIGLWTGDRLMIKELACFFSGTTKMKTPLESFPEGVSVPMASRSVIEASVKEAIKSQVLWLLSGPASVLGEDIPAGLLTDDAILMSPPVPIPFYEIMPVNLSEAWNNGQANARNIYTLLSKKRSINLPWVTVKRCIDDAVRSKAIEVIEGWPCDETEAKKATLKVILERTPAPLTMKNAKLMAEAKVSSGNLQTLGEEMGDILKLAVGANIEFTITVQVDVDKIEKEKLAQLNRKLKEINETLELK